MLDATGVRNRTAVFIVADHGFAAAPKALRPNAILRREGLLNVEGGRVRSGRVLAVAEGGVAMVYLTDPTRAERDRQTVIRLFLAQRVFWPCSSPRTTRATTFPNRATTTRWAISCWRRRRAMRSASTPEATRSSCPTKSQRPEAHGFLSTEPKMNAIFVAAGSGIKAGTKLTTVDNIDVAPTIARLLDVSLEHATGRVLDEILYDAKSESTPRRGQLTETRVVKQMK